jgi:YidC/Oxa1 family membrane protein insertase
MDFITAPLGQVGYVLLVQPLINVMVVTYALLGHNFVLATLASTFLVQLVTWPLTMQSMNSSKKMQQLQQSDKWKDAQKKYKGDREKMAQVTMELYKEAGVNPAAGCLPTVIQMPLLIAFYSSINQLVAVNPESLLDLTKALYRFIPFIADIAVTTIPLQSQFLWLNLARPDPYFVIPVLVAASTWFSQRTMSMPSADPQQAQMNQSMQLMMPLMFGWFAVNFASGVAIYWIISSLARMFFQGMTQGWKFVLPEGIGLAMFGRKPAVALSGASQGRASKQASLSARNSKDDDDDDDDDEPVAPPAPKKIAPVAPSNGNPNAGGKRRARRQSRR